MYSGPVFLHFLASDAIILPMKKENYLDKPFFCVKWLISALDISAQNPDYCTFGEFVSKMISLITVLLYYMIR